MLSYETRFVNHTNETVTLNVAKFRNSTFRVTAHAALVVPPGRAEYILSSTLKEMHNTGFYTVMFKIFSDNKDIECITAMELDESKEIVLKHEGNDRYKIDLIPGFELDITRTKYITRLRNILWRWSSKAEFKNYTTEKITLKEAEIDGSGTWVEIRNAPVEVRIAPVEVPAGSTKYISFSMLEEKEKLLERPVGFMIFSGNNEFMYTIESGTLAKSNEIVLGCGKEADDYFLFTYCGSELAVTTFRVNQNK